MSSKSPGTGSLGTHELSKLQFPKKQKQKKYSKPIRPIDIKSSSLNIACKICGDRSSGYHYGVHACEGCKGFFRRTVRLKLDYEQCSQVCTVDVRNRNKCQYCRYQKCIQQGMSHDAIRYGRMPKQEKERIIADTAKLVISPVSISPDQTYQHDKIILLIKTISTSYMKHITASKVNADASWVAFSSLGSEAKKLRCLDDIPVVYPCIHQDLEKLKRIVAKSSDGVNAGDGKLLDYDFSLSNNFTNSYSLPRGSQNSSFVDNENGNIDVSAENVITSNTHCNCVHTTQLQYSKSSLVDERQLSNVIRLSLHASDEKIPETRNDLQLVKCIPTEVNFHHISTLTFGLPAHENYCVVDNIAKLHNLIAKGYSDIRFHQLQVSSPKIIVKIDSPATLRKLMKEFTNIEYENDNRLHSGNQRFSKFSSLGFTLNGEGEITSLPLVQLLVNKLQQRMTSGISELTEFAKHIPGFSDLNLNDQVMLLKYGSYEAMFVYLGNLLFGDGLYFPATNTYVTTEFLNKLGLGYMLIAPKLKFAKKLASLELNDSETALFLAILLLSPDRPDLIDPATIEKLQEDVITCLQFQLSLSHPHKPRLFANLLMMLTDLRQLVAEHVVMVAKWEALQKTSPPLLREILEGL